MLKKLLRTLQAAVCIGSLTAAALVIAPKLVGISAFSVMSGSMEPTVPTGSIIWIDTNRTSPEKGEIIAFTAADGRVITHRVAGIVDGSYVTKGDANASEDPNLLSKDRIVGTYINHLPYLGTILSNPAYKTAWAALLIIMAFLPDLKKPKRKEPNNEMDTETTA